MKVLFADDHFLILEGLKELVRNKFPTSKVLTAVNKTELFDKLEKEHPTILIQDLKFGSHNAAEFIDSIKNKYPDTKILILSSVSDSSTINKTLKKTDGYILKSEPSATIIEGIFQILNGETYISPQALTIKNSLFSDAEEIPLTKRERDVVREIMKELSTKTIAKNLNISEKTVEMHRSNIYLKLNVNNVAGLVKKVIGLDILGN